SAPCRAGTRELLPSGAGPAYIRAGEPRKSGTTETVARWQDRPLRGGCVIRWNESIASLLGPIAAADSARSPPHASSRRRRIRPRDAALALCTALLIGCGASTFIWHGQVTPLVVGFALSAATAVILAWLSVRSLGRQQLAAARLRRDKLRLTRRNLLLQSTLENI